MTSPREQPVVIQGSLSTPMLGVLTSPGENVTPSGLGVVIVNGGAQYRAGAHRMHVQLARHLANAGHTALRFDFPGQGDSPGDPVSFEATAPHIGAAIERFQRQCPGVDRVVLWGLCDGASASLLYVQATQDPRIAGLALLNPWVRTEAGLARAQVKHYYRQRLLEPAFWRKLLNGGVGWQALRGLGANLRRMRRQVTQTASFQDRMAQGWQAFPGPILLLLSERDLTAQEFSEHSRSCRQWSGCMQQDKVLMQTLPGADHTGSRPEATRRIQDQTLNWITRYLAAR